MDGLLGVELLGILHAEAEEVTQLCSGVNLSLPCILALAVHSQGHNIVSVLGGDQIGGLEKNAGAFAEWKCSP